VTCAAAICTDDQSSAGRHDIPKKLPNVFGQIVERHVVGERVDKLEAPGRLPLQALAM